ncbi:hypothetical protein GSI_11670 [Ganoderma sinense ZZ0214-1]|uniref:Uncharacterized protein n=1 Tax=Ganoderma sinense ZZ0214-1 TaxID=1077348 RepID=A0A2G8RWP9_9APHY|nr:hypothetical protein GSI_11670 [Ganoderma sinense ZZ0214-1]
MALRIGHTVGEFHWQAGSEAGHSDRLILKEEDLTPYSLKNLEARPGFTFPYATDASRTLSPEKVTRVQAIYWRRFQYKMSEKESGETAVTFTEPTQERAFAKADEEVVTIRGFSGVLTVEYLFSGIYTIFPPKKEWSILFSSCASPVVSFFMPDSEGSTGANCNSSTGDTAQEQPSSIGQFYFRDRLIATNPAGFCRVGVNYSGSLDTSESEFDPQVTGKSLQEFQQYLFRAVDMGIRRLPELAVELAIDILTNASALPDDCGPIPSFVGSDTEVKHAYRTAFEAAWRRLDPNLASHEGGLYPYVQSLILADEEKALILDLGMHPIPVDLRVRLLLAMCGAYPLVKDHAETLLLSAVGAAHLPTGVDILKAALPKLLPDADLAADPLSVRQYTHSYPRVVWDPDTRVFVMASSLGARRCSVHKDIGADHIPESGELQAREKESSSQCLCWIGLALQAAASSWQAKNSGRRSRPGFDEEFFHILLDCYQTAFPALRTSGLAAGSQGRGGLEPPSVEEDDVLSYCSSTPPRSEGRTSQASRDSPRASGETPAAKPTPPLASSTRGSTTVPYPSPGSSPPLPRRQVIRRAAQLQLQQSPAQPNTTATGSGAQGPSENREQEKAPKDMTDLFRMFEKAAQGMMGMAQASKPYMVQWQKESAAVREELAEERVRRTALDAAFAAYKLESEAALAANAEAMKQKDARIGHLEESVSALTARVQEQAAAVDRQAALSQDQTERIQELKQREKRWVAHMKEMLAELHRSSSPQVRNGAASDEEEARGPRKRVKLS